jgi:membrane-associated phospholipid phosphatase
MSRQRMGRRGIVLAVTVLGSLLGLPVARAASDSVYQVDPIVDGAIIGASVAATIGIYAFAAGSIDTRCPCDRNEVNAFDRFAVGYHSNTAAVLSELTAGAALLAPVALDWLAVRDLGVYAEDLTVYAQAIAVSGALTVIAKQLSQRPFPRTYAGDSTLVSSANGYRSFYSGHVALTFTALSAASFTINKRYGWTLVPWLVTGLVGASVAVERVAAGWHFPTDVVAGAVMGTAIGVLVPLVHLRRLAIAPTLTLLPGGQPALALAGRWK